MLSVRASHMPLPFQPLRRTREPALRAVNASENAVFVGFCYFSMTTALNTMLQHLADDDKRGRIMSLFVVTWGGLIPVGAIWMGALADATSAPLGFVIDMGASPPVSTGRDVPASPAHYV